MSLIESARRAAARSVNAVKTATSSSSGVPSWRRSSGSRQRRLRVSNIWYSVDLLFFHRTLRWLVIIDLKLDDGESGMLCDFDCAWPKGIDRAQVEDLFSLGSVSPGGGSAFDTMYVCSADVIGATDARDDWEIQGKDRDSAR